MRCEVCAKDIPSGQEVYSTKSEQVGSPGYTGAFTSTLQVVLCPACAERRNRRELWLWVAVLGIFIAGMVILIRELWGAW